MALMDVFGRAFDMLGGAFGAAQQGTKLPGTGSSSWADFADTALPGNDTIGADYSLAGGGGDANYPHPGGGGQANYGLPGGGTGANYGLPGGGGMPDYSLPGGGSMGYEQLQMAEQAAQATRDLYARRRKPGDYTNPTPGNPGYGQPGTAVGAGLGSDTWVEKINQHAAKYGDMPELAEVAQALIELESSGDPNAQGKVVTSGAYAGQRAQGLGQIMPGNYPGVNLLDPDTNIRLMMEMLTERYRRYGNWDSAVASYFGAVDANGRPTTQADDNGTTGVEYVEIINKHRRAIQAARAAQAPKTTTNAGGVGLGSVFGGVVPPGMTISQGMERTPYSTGPGASVYDYGTEFGLDGDTHTGWDVSVPRGTAFYMPAGLTGQVVKAGGTGVFKSNNGPDGPGRGELKILLSNGMEVIFGHSDRIDVQVGQQITAGQLLGLTGSSDGDHMHLEVRVRDPSTRSGWRIVDPSILFGNAATGGAGQHNH